MSRGSTTQRRVVPCISLDIAPQYANGQKLAPTYPDLTITAVEEPSVSCDKVPVLTAAKKSTTLQNGIFVKYGLPTFAAFFLLAGVTLVYLSLTNNIEVSKQTKVYATTAQESTAQGGAGKGDKNGTANSNNTSDPQFSGVSDDPSKPRGVAIPAIGVNAPTTVVGINSKNEIGTPANIHYASWYEGSSSLLDKAGTSIIVGHKGTDRNPGVFAKLSRVQAGADIFVTMGDGAVISYKVASLQIIEPEKMDMMKYLSYLGNTKRVLYLMSCDGSYDGKTYTYSKRVIVKAESVQ